MKKTLRQICEDNRVSRRAVQGYESMRLVCAADKNKYGHLLYDETAEQRIQLIHFYQRIGFSLKEIQMILNLPNQEKKQILCKRMDELKRRQGEMSDLIKCLEHHIKTM